MRLSSWTSPRRDGSEQLIFLKILMLGYMESQEGVKIFSKKFMIIQD